MNVRKSSDYSALYATLDQLMAEAMAIGWTQNVIILEAELTLQEKAWYIRAVRQLDDPTQSEQIVVSCSD